MKNITIICICLLFTFATFAQTDPVFAYMEHEVICMGSEMDGTQMVRAFGDGKNKKDAKAQAGKGAINAVLFKGITQGREGCRMAPLVNTPNAREQFADFFNEFFADGGGYLNYISVDDTPKKTITKERGVGKGKIIGMIVTVNMPALKKELIAKGIIPKD